MFYGENVVCVPVHLFLTFIFTLVAASISHLHRRYKIFMLLFQRNWSPFFVISRSSSFSVFDVNVDIKI